MPQMAWLTVDALVVLLACLTILSLALVFGALRRGGRREDPVRDDATAASRFTLPVSIIVPHDGYSAGLSETVASLLALNYPEFEVIVVVDEPNKAQHHSLEREWELAPREYFYRRSVATAAVRRILESRRDERLMLVEKGAAGRADALNCGLTLARFRYVACVAPTVIFDANGLLRLMTPALRDPANVLASTGHLERRPALGAGPLRGALRSGVWKRAEGDWQRISSVRAWFASRIIASRLHGGLVPQDAVIAWRRDALLDTGGFSPDAADPESEMLLRLQAPDGPAGAVIRTGEIVGRRHPIELGMVARLRAQRQRAVIAAVWALRRTTQPPGSGRAEALSFLLVELLTPLAQCSAIVAVILGATAGWFSWTNLVLLVVVLAFGNAAITAAALLLRGTAPGGPAFPELIRLLLLAPVEYVVYRPAIALARLTTGRH